MKEKNILQPGQVIDGVKIIEQVIVENGRKKWKCLCLVCGNIKQFKDNQLKTHPPKSCGCQQFKYKIDLYNKVYGDFTITDRIEGKWEPIFIGMCNNGHKKNFSHSVIEKHLYNNFVCKECIKENLSKKIDYHGTKVGRWTIQNKTIENRTGVSKYLCKCECGREKNVNFDHLKRGNTLSCGKCHKHGKDSSSYGGYEEIDLEYFNEIKRSSNGEKHGNRRVLDFNLSIEFLWELFLTQNRKCALSGIELQFRYGGKEQTASLDRIDNNRGYIMGNVQWVHKHVNFMKRNLNQDYFISLCKEISNNNK